MQTAVEQQLITWTRASEQGRVRFPELVATLTGLGVERYYTDLVRATKTYYSGADESAVVECVALEVGPAAAFDPAAVAAAVARTQAGETDYLQFCREIAAAGCVAYLASFVGRRVVYYGRTGDSLVEEFPQV